MRMLPLPFFLLCASIASALPLKTSRLSCEVVDTAKATILTTSVKGSDTTATFRIDWFSGSDIPQNFNILPARDHSLTSTHRLAETTLTRTILASPLADCILIHIVADKPGAVSFKARFVSKSPSEIHDRREIILSAGKVQAHAWILPFESDVSDDSKGTITLSGEGEALILLNLTANPGTHPISATLTDLGEKYDSGHQSPNPHLLWEGVIKGMKIGKEE